MAVAIPASAGSLSSHSDMGYHQLWLQGEAGRQQCHQLWEYINTVIVAVRVIGWGTLIGLTCGRRLRDQWGLRWLMWAHMTSPLWVISKNTWEWRSCNCRWRSNIHMTPAHIDMTLAPHWCEMEKLAILATYTWKPYEKRMARNIVEGGHTLLTWTWELNQKLLSLLPPKLIVVTTLLMNCWFTHLSPLLNCKFLEEKDYV